MPALLKLCCSDLKHQLHMQASVNIQRDATMASDHQRTV